jgi:prepilin-type N-terminal cleavage/methylation domain-containing protein
LRTARPALLRRVARRPDRAEGGFTLIEVMICTLILTTGMLGIAGLLAVTTQMHHGAREAARSTRLAQEKIDELMKLDIDTDPKVLVGGSLTNDVANYCAAKTSATCTANALLNDGVTVRWTVAAGPVTDTRVLTVRVANLRAQQYGRQVELSTIIRQW